MITPIADTPLDAYWMPFTANRAFKAAPRMIARAEGVHYITDDNRRIVDATSGLYCVNAGHCRAPIVAAIAEAARTLDYAPAFQFGHEGAFRLAARLAALAPAGLDHVLFASSGSEAIDTAMKVALSYHRLVGQGSRTRFIGRERGYHGCNFGGTAVGGIGNNRRGFPLTLPGVDHLATTYDRGRQAFSVGEPEWGAHLADDLERLVALHGAETIAAVIVEPVAGSTGCLPPPKGYLPRLAEIARAHGILVIFDEVITAFGRLGHTFAAARFGVRPDMITFAKAVTNGAVPLSGVLVAGAIRDVHMQGPPHAIELAHGYTYSGHPLAVAAAHATLDLTAAEGLANRAQTNEAAFADAMMRLRQSRHVVDIRPIGLMCGIDLAPDPAAPGRRGLALTEAAFRHHDLYIRVGGDTAIVAPPLVMEPAGFDDIASRLTAALEELD
jgi:beta-alanine--pyruvate transaminase